MIPSELAEKIIRLTWHQTNVIAAATMIEARDERIRREERERCLQAVAGERLRDDARTPEDVAYQHAIDDCLAAIRSLAPEAGADPAHLAEQSADETAAWNALVRACAEWATRMDQWEKFRFNTPHGMVFVSLHHETEYPDSFDLVEVPGGEMPDPTRALAHPNQLGVIVTDHFHRRPMPLGPVLSALCSQENNDGDEGNAMAAAYDLLHALFKIADDVPELNMSNYDEDDVARLNAGVVEIHLLLRAALALGEAG